MVSPESENPYASAVREVEPSTVHQRQSRPYGIWVVSIVNMLPGVAILSVVLLMAIQFGIAGTIAHIRTQGYSALVVMSWILPIGVISGVGVSMRNRWSWYGSIFYCSFHIYGTFQVFLHDQGSVWAATVILINLCFVIYLLSERPCQYLRIGPRYKHALAFGIFLLSVAQYHILVWLGSS